MDISILGLGYVGTVCGACLAGRGHRVIGCDVQESKVNAINSGASPIEEPHLAELVAAGLKAGLLSAVSDPAQAVRQSAISLVCVGTPSSADGSIDLRHLTTVCGQVGRAVAALGRPHTVVIRSTVLPAALGETVVPALRDAAGAGAGNLRICTNPEFLREGAAISDFNHPPMIVIGENRPCDGDALAEMYKGIDAPLYRVGMKEANMVKYACNMFHALKIIFGNEVGMLCQASGMDSHQVMEVFCQDKQLNISHRYLKPGYAYGGSCLPKDLKAMLHFARHQNVEAAMLSAVARSNALHIEKCVQAVVDSGARKVGVLGLSFKDDTDDLRESPTVEIVERLIGKGLEVRIHDKDVAASRVFGSNLTFVQKHLPHLASLMRPTPQEVIQGAETVVLAKPSRLYADVQKHVRADQTLVDLVRFLEPGKFTACKYVGLVG